MIPISRRTMARASWLLALLGQGLEVEAGQLLAGRAGAGALGEQRDEQGQDAVEVVEVVGRLVPGEDEQVPSMTWMKTATWAARSRYQKGTEAWSRSQQ